jgi:hypothetical protein
MMFTVFYPDFLGECARFDRHVSDRSPRYTHRIHKGTHDEDIWFGNWQKLLIINVAYRSTCYLSLDRLYSSIIVGINDQPGK